MSSERLQPLSAVSSTLARHRMGIVSVLAQGTVDPRMATRSEMAAGLLMTQPPRLITYDCNNDNERNNNVADIDSLKGSELLSSSLMMTEDLSFSDNLTKIHLLDDSSENVSRIFSVHGYARKVTCDKRHGLVLTASSKSSSAFRSKLTVVRLSEESRTCDLGTFDSIDWDASVHDIAVTDGCTIAIAAKMIIYVMKIRTSDTAMPLIMNAIPTFDIDALSIDFTPDGNQLTYIAEDGRLTLRDLRACGLDSPDWSVQASKSVVDHTRVRVQVSQSRTELYLASEEGLSAWDFRMSRDYEPNRVFDGFEAPTSEWYYSSPLDSIFDVEETCSGLLAATGESGAVQVWDCHQGGPPLAAYKVPQPAQRVQFTSWTNPSVAPGLWVHGGCDAYMLRAGRHRPRG